LEVIHRLPRLGGGGGGRESEERDSVDQLSSDFPLRPTAAGQVGSARRRA